MLRSVRPSVCLSVPYPWRKIIIRLICSFPSFPPGADLFQASSLARCAEMRPIATDVSRSMVCVSVCVFLLHGSAVQKRLNRSCEPALDVDLRDPEESRITLGQRTPTGMGTFGVRHEPVTPCTMDSSSLGPVLVYDKTPPLLRITGSSNAAYCQMNLATC